MVNFQQCFRIIVFAYITFLPIFLTLWCITLLPEIIDTNLGYHLVKDQSTVAGQYFTFFFYGLMLGSLAWPYLVTFSSKRNAIFIALSIQCVVNAFQLYYNSIYWLCFCRFIMGFMHNLNTVGKDFIFEFADHDHRQYAFSFKSCFGMIASFVGPYIGYYIYKFSGQSFQLSTIYISIYFYLPALILFVLLFYCNFKPGEIEDRNTIQTNEDQNQLQKDEEIELINQGVLVTQKVKIQKRRGLWGVFKHCLKDKEIRGYVLVYLMTHGVFKAATMIIIFFMEQSWAQDGLGVSTKDTSIANLISYFPSAFVLLYSPKLVPSFFQYKTYIRTIVFTLATIILLMPILRDFFTQNFVQKNPWFVYGDLVLFNCFSPRIFSPFINYILNSKISRNDRTSINSVIIILSTLTSSLLINIIAPLYAYTLGSQFLQNFQPFNKYISFAILSFLLILGQSQMLDISVNNSINEKKNKINQI